MPELVKWKDGVVKKLNTGVAALLKRAKVRVVEGWATFSDAKTCTVRRSDHHGRARHPRQRLKARRAAVPALRRQCDLVDRGARTQGTAQEARRRGRGLYRPRTRHRLPQVRKRGDGGRGAGSHPAALRCGTGRARGEVAEDERRDLASGRQGQRRGRARPHLRDHGRQNRRRFPPTRSSSPSAASRTPKAGASRPWRSTWTGASSRSTTSAAPR